MGPKKKKYYSRCNDLYVFHEVDVPELAKLFPVSEATLNGWRREHKWDEERLEIQSSPARFVHNIKKEIYDLIKQAQVTGQPIDADRCSKLYAITKDMSKKADVLGHMRLFVQDLTGFLKEKYPKLGKLFGQQAFIEFTDYLFGKYTK